MASKGEGKLACVTLGGREGGSEGGREGGRWSDGVIIIWAKERTSERARKGAKYVALRC